MSNERKQRQTRSLPQRFETREAEGGALYIEGYFAVFDSPYELWEGAVEIVKPGAFAGCLSQDVRALINHDTTLVLGPDQVRDAVPQGGQPGPVGKHPNQPRRR